MAYYLSGDIGGTKTLLCLTAEDAAIPVLQKSYPSGEFAGLADILTMFLHEAGGGDIAAACLALAAPVTSRQVRLTNLPWVVDADALAAQFGIRRVSLINDFAAVGYGIAALTAADVLPLQAGMAQPQGVRLAVGAGTGLGVAWLSPSEQGYVVHPSEGGHSSFSPSNDVQYALLHYLQARHGHVSFERVVSGMGIVAIYEFLRDTQRATPSPALLQAMLAGDAAAALAQAALVGREAIACMTLDLFVELYGAFVGNMALAALPRGGIYLAGGIAAKIVPLMQHGKFKQAYLAKGRFTELLASFPMYLVTHAHIGLLGAAQQARENGL